MLLQVYKEIIFLKESFVIKRIIYPKSDRIIAISNGVKISLVDKLSIDSKMVNVIYNPAQMKK